MKLQLTFRIRPDFPPLDQKRILSALTTKHGRAELGSSLEEALVNAIEVGILDAPGLAKPDADKLPLGYGLVTVDHLTVEQITE